jgi:hypothetical protein
VSGTAETPLGLERVQRGALVIGIAVLAACAAGGLENPPDFFRAYLVGYLYWLGIALGALVILMLHYLSGGAWGLVVRRILESATRTLPLLALLFLPLAVGVRDVYIWAAPGALDDPLLRHKSAYLNVPFFLGRAVIYFGAWLGCAYIFNKWSRERDARPDPNPRRFRLLAGPGLALYGLTVTFAAIDWAMSLEPHWYSTIYPAAFGLGQVLSAFAFATALAVALRRHEPFGRLVTAANLNDLGNLMLAFVMLWAYVNFSQFLLIWSANIREEVPWFLARQHGAWGVVAAGLIALHFALPFVLLLSRRVKRDPRLIGAVAVGILVARLVADLWLLVPGFHRPGFALRWLDVVVPVGVGGIWLAAFLGQLRGRPLVPLNDPAVEEAVAHAH